MNPNGKVLKSISLDKILLQVVPYINRIESQRKTFSKRWGGEGAEEKQFRLHEAFLPSYPKKTFPTYYHGSSIKIPTGASPSPGDICTYTFTEASSGEEEYKTETSVSFFSFFVLPLGFVALQNLPFHQLLIN